MSCKSAGFRSVRWPQPLAGGVGWKRFGSLLDNCAQLVQLLSCRYRDCPRPVARTPAVTSGGMPIVIAGTRVGPVTDECRRSHRARRDHTRPDEGLRSQARSDRVVAAASVGHGPESPASRARQRRRRRSDFGAARQRMIARRPCGRGCQARAHLWVATLRPGGQDALVRLLGAVV